jgi:hypothetical protein
LQPNDFGRDAEDQTDGRGGRGVDPVNSIRNVALDERVRYNDDRKDGDYLDRGGHERQWTKVSHARHLDTPGVSLWGSLPSPTIRPA